MQVVAAVKAFGEALRVKLVPDGFVKIDAPCAVGVAAHPFVQLAAHFLPEGGIGSPAIDGKQRSEIDRKPHFFRLCYVPAQPLDELRNRGQIAHGPEYVHIRAHGMDDVVDALLDDQGIGSGGGDFMVEAVCALETIGVVGDAAVFPQHPGAAGGSADDGGVAAAQLPEPQLQIVRPVLGGDGVAVADDGVVFRRGIKIHIAEKIEPVGGLGFKQRQTCGVGLIAEGEKTLGQRPGDQHRRLHQGEVLQIDADADRCPRGSLEGDRIADDPLPGIDFHAFRPAEGNVHDSLFQHIAGQILVAVCFGVRQRHGGPGNLHGFGAAVIVKGEPQGIPGKGNVDGIAQGDISGEAFRSVLGNGDGIAPYRSPVHRFFFHGEIPFLHFGKEKRRTLAGFSGSSYHKLTFASMAVSPSS